MILGDGQLAEAVRAEFPDPDFIWVCHDTPTHDDKPDVDSVLNQIDGILAGLDHRELVVLSSQLPAGTCARLERDYPSLWFAVVPENMRRGHPEDWARRVIVGVRDDLTRNRLAKFFAPRSVISMSPESAEMTKHATNAYLAATIAFANELGALCETVGATPADVVRGLRTDWRISPHAPLIPGEPFEGPLGRDLYVLETLGAGRLIRTIRESNSAR